MHCFAHIDVGILIFYTATMHRNKLDEISKISSILASENSVSNVNNFIIEMLTKAELETLSKRWQILKMLSSGATQRTIAKELNVSLCKVTRGSQILKKKNSIVCQYLEKENDNECK